MKMEQILENALEHALKKIEKNLNELNNLFPFVTVNGKSVRIRIGI